MCNRDIILSILVVLSWSLNGVFTKYCVMHISPCFLNFLRFALLIPLTLCVPIPRMSIINLSLIALTWFMSTLLMLTFAYKEGLPVGFGGLLQQSSVILSVFLSFLVFKEVPKKNQMLGLFISITGLIYIICVRSKNIYISNLAISYGLLSGVFMAIGIILIKKQTQKSDAFIVIWYSAISAIPTGIMLFFQNEKFIISNLSETNFLTLGTMLLYGAFIAIFYSNRIWYKLVSTYTTATLSPFMLLSPLFSILLSYLFLNEKTDISTLMGGGLIILGLVINTLKIDQKVQSAAN